ncbi:MAG TPA: hypothetical protein VMG10_19525 [Gemmataceae bacterium]|nr:hypothetical protein [Gemmataceae bacterium]
MATRVTEHPEANKRHAALTAPNQLPLLSGDAETGFPGMTDLDTGKTVPVADVRAEFERLSRQAPRDPEAERAFIESKIEMIRNDPHLSEEEKQRAIEQLRSRLQ